MTGNFQQVIGQAIVKSSGHTGSHDTSLQPLSRITRRGKHPGASEAEIVIAKTGVMEERGVGSGIVHERDILTLMVFPVAGVTDDASMREKIAQGKVRLNVRGDIPWPRVKAAILMYGLVTSVHGTHQPVRTPHPSASEAILLMLKISSDSVNEDIRTQ